MTLTTNPAAHQTPDEAARALVITFRKLIRSARKTFDAPDLQYFAVFERTKQGWPHLHVLLRGTYIPQAWISAFMARELAAPIVDIRSVKNSRRAIAYVTKYCTKSPHRFPGCQRFWCSRSWDLGKIDAKSENEAIPEHDWLIIRYDSQTLLNAVRSLGWQVREGPFGGFLAWPPG